MLKVELIKKNKGTSTLIFETRNTTPEGLEELDEVYSALLGSRPRRGGYLDSNRFEVEVKDPDIEDTGL